MSVTILDVAQAAQVSKSTVSLVLKDSPLIRGETAERVRRAARDLGYVYNRRAAGLRAQTSDVVGVVINDLMNPFFAEVLVGIERRLGQAGYLPLIAHTQEDLQRQRDVVRSMREHHAAGLLLCPALGTQPAELEEIEQAGIPLVLMVRSLGRGSEHDFVGTDNAAGVLQATRHLLDAGHRRIAFLGGIGGPVYQERVRGWKKALRERGIAPQTELLRPAMPTREGGYGAAVEALALAQPPTAAVCYNDIAAFGVLWALAERGLRAGRDFAVVGSDDVLDAAHSNPPLTTVDVEPGELGERAAQALLARIADPAAPRRRDVQVPALVVRQSG